jgi:hypothetical protein
MLSIRMTCIAGGAVVLIAAHFIMLIVRLSLLVTGDAREY